MLGQMLEFFLISSISHVQQELTKLGLEVTSLIHNLLTMTRVFLNL